MAFLIKPRTLGLMTKVERQGAGASLIVSAYGLFNLAAPDPFRFEDEQGLWTIAAKELPPGAVFDIGMPKPVAEVLVGGYAAAAGGEPVTRMGLSFDVAGLRKSLLVTGDRTWRLAGTTAAATEPVPFVQMPLSPARCFGGEGHASSPLGTGFRARERLLAREAAPLPNIEIPEQAVRSFTDTPEPARFGPMAVDAKERLRYAGTYDTAWLTTRAPALPADVDPRLFLFAPEEQRLTRHLEGGERYRLQGFSADHPVIEAALPDFRVRCFVGWTDPAKAVVEVPLRIDTLWLFAGAGRGVLIHRGALAVEDFEAADVADIMVAYEAPGTTLPLSHYLRVRQLRTDREQGYKYALSDHQLAPARSRELIDARSAARRARDAAKQEKRAENLAWVQHRQLAQSGLPPALWPSPPGVGPDEPELPLPLPEEIAAGEIDLAALLDALEAVHRDAETRLANVQAEFEPKRQALAALNDEQADPTAIDRLFDTLDQPQLPAGLDAALAHLPAPSSLPPAARDQADLVATLEEAKDWRRSMLAAARPAVDESAQLALARARFLGLPEGRPFAGLLAGLDGLSIPEGGDWEPPARTTETKPPADAPLAEILDRLDNDPALPEGSATTVKSGLAEIDAALRRSYPNLDAPPGGAMAAVSALIEASGPARDPYATPAEALAQARADMASLSADLTERMAAAEDASLKASAAMRQASPVPTRPEEPLTPAVARSFGDLILDEAHNGVSLAGRDLAGADLSGADLSGCDLSGAFLESVRLDGASLIGARLSGATLCGASLVGTDFTGCDLGSANLAAVDATRARFVGARLADANVAEARFAEAIFDEAELSDLTAMGIAFEGASFRGARVSGCILTRCALSGTDWTGASVERIQILDSDCANIAFHGSRLTEVGFLMVRAEGADFSDATLTRVTFAGEVDLRGAHFTRMKAQRFSAQTTDLRGASFERARLDGACFVESRLSQANLRASSLKRAILSRNDLGGADFSFANLWEAQLNRADLRGTCFASANLYGADLADARLTGADLAGANLGRTLFEVASDD